MSRLCEVTYGAFVRSGLSEAEFRATREQAYARGQRAVTHGTTAAGRNEAAWEYSDDTTLQQDFRDGWDAAERERESQS